MKDLMNDIFYILSSYLTVFVIYNLVLHETQNV